MQRSICLLTALSFMTFPFSTTLGDAVDRAKMPYLKAEHEAVAALAGEWQAVTLDDGFDDYRAVVHVHSYHSHDSNGSLEEIRAAAKAVGVRVVMFTDHPADSYDYFTDGHRGMEDGVLFVPGAETSGFLSFPSRSVQGEQTSGPQEYADLVREDDGLVFLSHLEERLDWNIAGLTGTEIYNTHADVKDEGRLLSVLRSPFGLLTLMPALEKYPQEFFAALQDYPADYLKRWDELCREAPHTGVAANDSHHNQGVLLRLNDEGKVDVVDLLDKKITTLDPASFAPLRTWSEGKKPGDVVKAIDLDPYERSFRHVSTHLLMNELSVESVREALKHGRVYVAFDWMGDPSGFVFQATRDGGRFAMGSEIEGPDGLALASAAPLPGLFKVLRDGEIIHEHRGRTIEFDVREPGNYRVEVWLPIAGELKPWILSNPIYVRPGA